MAHTIPNIYKKYDGPLSYAGFREVCEEFNKLVMEEILKGKEFHIGFRLSSISIIRIERNFKNPPVDWNETNKYKQELLEEGYTEDDFYHPDNNPDGKKYFIYHTDPWYCRFYWNKLGCRVKNKSVYSFVPTRGKKGNVTKLKQLLKEDDLAYLNFKLV